MLLPKERQLLILVQQIQEEIAQRHKEGISGAQLGMQDVVSPDEKLIDRYNQEVENVFSLLKEVETLETQAKRQADFEILNAIASLKRQIHQMVEAYSPSDSLAGKGDHQAKINSQTQPSVSQKTISSQEMSVTLARSDDLFEQWKYNRLLDHKLKQTKYELIHARLLATATPIQKERMFRRELRDALLSYSDGDFQLSRMLFLRIVDTYPDRRIDDVLFYAGESAYALNYLDDALALYRKEIQTYPNSEFTAKALVKVFNVFYIYHNYEKLYKAYEKIQLFRSQIDSNTWNTLTYLMAYAEFQNMQFEAALSHFLRIMPGHPFYYPALYMAATCQVNLGQEELAMQSYQTIVTELENKKSNPALGQIRNNALLKLGLSLYEKGQNERAIAMLNRVSSNSDYYDLSMMGKAWSAYRAGRPGEALMNAEELLQTSAVSNYTYEAKLLAASAKELLGNKEEALSDLKQLYKTARQDASGSASVGSSGSSDVDALLDVSQERRTQSLMREAKKIQAFMHGSGETMQRAGTEVGPNNGWFGMLDQQFSNLDTLEQEAQRRKDMATVTQIRTLRSQLMGLMGDQNDREEETSGENGRAEDLIRRLGETEYLNYTFDLLIQQIRHEKELSSGDMKQISDMIRKARTQDQFDLSIQLEIRQDELEAYLQRLNQYEVWLLENIPQATQMDISQWANFSGYGISNITFSRIKDLESRMNDLSNTIHDLNGVIQQKQLVFEQRIQELLSDVAKIEQEMSREERRRDQLEKDHYFETQYFDKQPKETPAEPASNPASRKKE